MESSRRRGLDGGRPRTVALTVALVLLVLLACKSNSDPPPAASAAPAPTPAAPEPSATAAASASAEPTTAPTTRKLVVPKLPVQDAAVAVPTTETASRKAGETCTRASQCVSGVCCETAASKTTYACANSVAECKSNVLRPTGATCTTMQQCDSLVCCRTATSGNASICAKRKADCK